MKPHEELDKLIDAALAGYSSTEPIDGLEARILRRVETARPARWRGWEFQFALAGCAVAALLLCIFAVRMLQPGAAPAPHASPAFAGLRETATLPSRPQAPPAKAVSATRRHRVPPKGLPKNEQFPAPAPLTLEERALLAWARSAPAQAQETLAALQTGAEDRVAIAPIQISPMQDKNAQ